MAAQERSMWLRITNIARLQKEIIRLEKELARLKQQSNAKSTEDEA